jgi:hypothetical protein
MQDFENRHAAFSSIPSSDQLPDGAIMSVNGNNLQASYEGSDGALPSRIGRGGAGSSGFCSPKAVAAFT